MIFPKKRKIRIAMFHPTTGTRGEDLLVDAYMIGDVLAIHSTPYARAKGYPRWTVTAVPCQYAIALMPTKESAGQVATELLALHLDWSQQIPEQIRAQVRRRKCMPQIDAIIQAHGGWRGHRHLQNLKEPTECPAK